MKTLSMTSVPWAMVILNSLPMLISAAAVKAIRTSICRTMTPARYLLVYLM
jgi:hypothetical protein